MNLIRGISDFTRLQTDMYCLSPGRLQALREKLVLGTVSRALAGSPFYRELYGTDRIAGMEPFRTLPVISKQIMMDHFDTLNTCGIRREDALAFALKQETSGDYSGYFRDRYVIGLSSGTSGNKGIYITPRSLTERLPFVFLARGGIPLRYLPFRILFLLRVFSQGFEDINAPGVSLSYRSTMTPPEELVRFINDRRINVVMAPPSMLRILMGYADRIRSPLKTIISYAEVLEKEEKERFRGIFGAEIREIYQASEGQIGSMCRCGSLHINEDLVHIELLDAEGRSVTAPGEPAERMLLTNLVNDAQPLIRYEMNDRIVLGDKCPCGSSFRVIRNIIGRSDDVLYLRTADGGVTHLFPDLFARWIITADDRIREFKVLEHSPDELEIRADLYRTGGSAETEAEILRRLDERVAEGLAGFGIRCTVRIVKTGIPLPEKMSKYKRFERLH